MATSEAFVHRIVLMNLKNTWIKTNLNMDFQSFILIYAALREILTIYKHIF